MSTARGHQAGAEKIEDFLGWCDEVGVEVVTLWLLSTDNLTRPSGVFRAAAAHHRGDGHRPRVARHLAAAPGGRLDLLPATTAEQLKAAEDATQAHRVCWSTSRSGNGGRREVVDAVRALIADAASKGPHPRRAPRPRSTSSTSPSTSTPRASPTPTS